MEGEYQMSENRSSIIPGGSCCFPEPKPKINPPSGHKLASAADFRNDVNEEDCYEPAREVFLPTGKKWVLLRKPRPLAYTLLGAPLPGLPEEGAEAANPEEQRKMSSEEAAQVATWLARLWGSIFVHPKLSLAPGAGEIHPDWIKPEDQQFIWRWIRGEVKNSGESLSTFPTGV
jgi:hypothetical protein